MANYEEKTAIAIETWLRQCCEEQGIEPQDVKDILIERWGIPIGKKDKHGNEMHVGDIVELRGEDKSIIMKDDDGIGALYYPDFWDMYNFDCEIIGNVDEDPELAEDIRGW